VRTKGTQPYHLPGGVSSLWFGASHHSDGGMTRESFTEFLAGTATHLDENETQYLIFDGVPAHC
jgi:hypothetical protein